MTTRTVTTTALVNKIILKTLSSHRITVESVVAAAGDDVPGTGVGQGFIIFQDGHTLTDINESGGR